MSIPDELRKELKHCEGRKCSCEAWNESECACGADWRSRDEVVMDWAREHRDLSVIVEYLGAIDAWNTRAERTCHNFGGKEGTNGEQYDFACDACGFMGDVSEPNFCPNCGAKVVDVGNTKPWLEQ